MKSWLLNRDPYPWFVAKQQVNQPKWPTKTLEIKVRSSIYLDLLVWWSEKYKHIPQMVVRNGDESHGRSRKKTS